MGVGNKVTFTDTMGNPGPGRYDSSAVGANGGPAYTMGDRLDRDGGQDGHMGDPAPNTYDPDFR